MLDQSFSATNFRHILDLENRKGVYLEIEFFRNIYAIINQIKECNKDIKKERKSKKRDKEELKRLYEKRRELQKAKEDQLMIELQKISDKVVATNFRMEMTKKVITGEKSLYIIKNSPECFFAMKQVQNNISRLFAIKHTNRFEIVNQVKILLSDGFPKYVIKTDIDDFYESIPHRDLLDKINGNNLMTPFSRKILAQILTAYRSLSGSDRGIPRGIGVSAKFAELYMRDVDSEIMSLKGISYYARYVDDMIIIFIPSTVGQRRNYLSEVKKIISKYQLSMNTVKTRTFNLQKSTRTYELEHLGYKIIFGGGILKTRLTDRKITKYKTRIDLALENYSNLSKFDEKKARKILIKRIRFLTGNTRLKNNKANILVGIYYSNCQLTEKNDLVSLDDYLRSKIDSTIKLNSVKDRLRKYTFRDGFETRRFSPFKTHELKQIMDIWE